MAAAFENASIATKLLTAGTSACIADAMTFPLDTAKVRLQIQGERQSSAQFGLIRTMRNMWRHEGPRSLYNGLAAGLQRQMCFASVRIGLYDTFKTLYQQLLESSSNSSQMGARILAGFTTGALAVVVAQPTDVVKVRLQCSTTCAATTTSTLRAYRTIAGSEGVRGLWRGTAPNASRNALVNVAEIVAYDVIKEALHAHELIADGVPLHFVAAASAGFCATLVASPVDVVKTRYMNAAEGVYKGALDCGVRMFAAEGPTAFYKGFVPSFARLVAWNIAMWIIYEQMKLAISAERRQLCNQ